MVNDETESIAVIGYAGRFPGAPNTDVFWRNLDRGVDTTTTLTDTDLDEAGVSPATRARPDFVRAAQLLDGVEDFDADFFGIPAGEAELLDPQHRIFLECAWETFEHAAYVPSAYPGHVGVFAGTGMSTYLLNNVLPAHPAADLALSYQLKLGNDKDFLATRVSYKLGLTGPSLSVQTACSTSLVAVHLAAQSLLDGECDAALAGGVSLLLPQRSGYLFQPGMILSPDGRCRPFDAGARGTVRGNGVGAVLLKRLSDAVRDGDTVHGVILGSAVNNDGSGKLGFTAPHEVAQREAVLQALAVAGVEAGSVSYVEAHGTGTELGDPVEVAALTAAFREDTAERGFCALGSVKGNIGHLDAAAGVAGLIKVLLMMRHRRIPGTAHFTAPNPRLELPDSPFHIPAASIAWETDDRPLRAGVSSTGIGGTNVHLVVEEPPRPSSAAAGRERELLLLSARSPEALEAASDRLVAHLRADPSASLADIAHTTQQGRASHRWRRAVVVESPSHAAEALRARPAALTCSAEAVHDGQRVALLFPGQGAQRPGMGRALARSEPVFRSAVDECAELFREPLRLDLRDVLWPSDPTDADAAALQQTSLAQPALFAVEYAMAQLWAEWGVQPSAMLGHSVGEYVAACLAGVFSLPDAAWLVAHRARLMQSAEPGAMVAVGLSEQELAAALPPGVELAAVNAESRCVISGPTRQVAAYRQQLVDAGVGCWDLRTSHAFHSSAMEPVLDEFTRLVAQAGPRAPQVPFVSNVTGDWITAEEATDPAYWSRQLRGTVRFHDGLRTLYGSPVTALVECGPGQALTQLARTHPARGEHRLVAATMSRTRGEDDLATTLLALGAYWASGGTPDWAAHHGAKPRRRVPLPPYPFEHTRYWLTPSGDEPGPPRPDAPRPGSAGVYLPGWRRSAPTPSRVRPEGAAWLLLGEQKATVRLADRLRALGHRVYCTERASAEAALADFGPVEHVVDVAARGTDWSDDEQQAAAVWRLLPSLPVGVRHWFVSDGLHRVESADRVRHGLTSLLGLAAVAPQELPGVHCHLVDVPAAGDVTDHLVAELTAEDPAPVVAIRGGLRLLPTFEPVHLVGAPGEGGTAASGLRRGGVYLITGGLGRVGSLLAGHLAGCWDARVVLTTRSEEGARAGYAAEEVRAAQGHGEVHVLRADVTRESDVQAAVQYCEDTFGTLHGVVHAAGVAGVHAIRTLRQTDAEFRAEQWRAKVAGARTLRKVVAGRELDFCLLMSSTAAVFGGPGLAAYAAANSGMDAFAECAADEGGTSWLSVGWDRWAEAGTQTVPGGERTALSVSDALETLERLLAAPVRGHVLVCAAPPAGRWRTWREQHSLRTAERTGPRTADPAVGGALEEVVADAWRSVLGNDQVELDDNFFDVGGDSLMGLRLVGELETRLGREVPVVRLFEAPTIRQLCELLEEERATAEGTRAETDADSGGRAHSPTGRAVDGTDELKAEAERARRRVSRLRKGNRRRDGETGDV